MNEEDRVAQGEFGFEGDECAAGVYKNGFRVFVKGTGFACKTVNDDRNAHRQALAGSGSLFGGCIREGHGERWGSCR